MVLSQGWISRVVHTPFSSIYFKGGFGAEYIVANSNFSWERNSIGFIQQGKVAGNGIISANCSIRFFTIIRSYMRDGKRSFRL